MSLVISLLSMFGVKIIAFSIAKMPVFGFHLWPFCMVKGLLWPAHSYAFSSWKHNFYNLRSIFDAFQS